LLPSTATSAVFKTKVFEFEKSKQLYKQLYHQSSIKSKPMTRHQQTTANVSTAQAIETPMKTGTPSDVFNQ
jgi:hypothetical protein